MCQASGQVLVGQVLASHAFQDYGGDKTKCICKKTCVCIEAGELPTNPENSPTTLAKLDWQGCTAPPTTIITPQLPTFKQYNAYNAPPPGTMHLCLEDAEDYTAWDAANPNTHPLWDAYPLGTAADCWEVCKNEPGANVKQAEYEVGPYAGLSRCICKKNCFCTEDTQAPTQAPNILAGFDWGGCTAPPPTIITPSCDPQCKASSTCDCPVACETKPACFTVNPEDRPYPCCA